MPVGIAVWCVHRHLKRADSERPYVEVVVAAVMAGVLVAALALLLGGEVGQYGWSGANWWLAGVLASVWLVVPGAVVAVMVAGLPRPAALGMPEQELDDAPSATVGPDTEEEAVDEEATDEDDAGEDAAEKEATDEAVAEEAAPAEAEATDEAVAEDDAATEEEAPNEVVADEEAVEEEVTEIEVADGDEADAVVKREPDADPDGDAPRS